MVVLIALVGIYLAVSTSCLLAFLSLFLWEEARALR